MIKIESIRALHWTHLKFSLSDSLFDLCYQFTSRSIVLKTLAGRTVLKMVTYSRVITSSQHEWGLPWNMKICYNRKEQPGPRLNRAWRCTVNWAICGVWFTSQIFLGIDCYSGDVSVDEGNGAWDRILRSSCHSQLVFTFKFPSKIVSMCSFVRSCAVTRKKTANGWMRILFPSNCDCARRSDLDHVTLVFSER